MDLFNQVIAAHAQPKKGFAEYNNYNNAEIIVDNRDVSNGEKQFLKRKAQTTFQHNRTSLLGAQRFSVSNQMLDHAISASLAKPARLVDMLATAIPCFDNMWIEWDVHHFMQKSRWLTDGVRQDDLPDDHHEKDLSTWPTRAGFHFMRMSEKNAIQNGDYTLAPIGEHTFAIMSYSVEETSKVAASKMALCLNFSLDEEARREWDHANFLNHIVQPLLGETYSKTHMKDQASIQTIAGAISFIGSPLDLCLNGQPYKLTGRSTDNIAPFFNATVGFFGQSLRTVITTLALLNYPHIIIQRDQPKTSNRDLYLGRKLPKNELKILEINLPKPRGTTQYEKMFKGLGNRQRQHTRRGHWRVLKMKCGGIKRTWVRECTAGDASLGVIIHDYHLKSKANVNSTKDYKSVV